MRLFRRASPALPLVAFLLCSACASSGGRIESADDPTLVAESTPAPPAQDRPMAASQAKEEGESEVPVAVAESEQHEAPPKPGDLPELVVEGRERDLVIRDLVAEGQVQLRDVQLQYVFAGKGGREVLRGRPVAFALWSEAQKKWTIAHLEIPRPPVKWKPGRGPLPFTVRTPGIEARHVKGTGAERLMFTFSRDGEELKVYGRKFPVFDNTLIKKKRWREAVATARSIVYLPFTQDTLDPDFVSGGKDFLLATARRAMDELRSAERAERGLSGRAARRRDTRGGHYDARGHRTDRRRGLPRKGQRCIRRGAQPVRPEARGSVSLQRLERESAGPHAVHRSTRQRHLFARRAQLSRRAAGPKLRARLRPALHNAMKAAVCLLDIELSQMSSEIRSAYRTNPEVLGIFAVAAYNGGPRNVAKLYRALDRMGVQLGELRRAGSLPPGSAVVCPCVWREQASVVRAVSIPRYNRENSGYIEKYQSILSLFD